jgi:hypothetical protein
MSDATNDSAPPYHLFLDVDEVPVAASALRLLISDEAHEPDIRRLAREVLAELEQLPDANGVLTVSLHAQQMKITYSAVKLLFNDLQRDEADEIEILRNILDKLPDEHVMRAITLE